MGGLVVGKCLAISSCMDPLNSTERLLSEKENLLGPSTIFPEEPKFNPNEFTPAVISSGEEISRVDMGINSTPHFHGLADNQPVVPFQNPNGSVTLVHENGKGFSNVDSFGAETKGNYQLVINAPLEPNAATRRPPTAAAAPTPAVMHYERPALVASGGTRCVRRNL
jgi:hypothetical protein